jgi:hypothetical protein
VLEHYGAAIGAKGPYIKAVKDKLRTALLSTVAPQELHKRALAAAKLQTIAIRFMKRADKRRYGGLWSKLENNFTRRQDHYPADLTNAYNLLLNYKAAPSPGQRPPQRDQTDDKETTGVSFLQDGSLIPGTGGETHHDIKCVNCNKKGHYASSCPDAEGVQLLQMANTDIDDGNDTYESAFSLLNVGHQPEECLFIQAATGHNLIPPTWILLDSQSTVSVFKKRAPIIRHSDQPADPTSAHKRWHATADADGPCEEFWPRLVQPRFPREHPVHGQSAQGLSHYHGHFRGARHVRAPA